MNGKASGVIEVTDGHAHARHLSAVLAYRSTGNVTDVFKLAIARVPIEIVGCRVIGDEQVGAAIVIKVTPYNPEAIISMRIIDPGTLGNIGEGCISTIVIKAVTQAFHSAGTALHRDAAKTAGRTRPKLRKVCQIEVHIA